MDMEDRDLARALALGRVVLGAMAVGAPRSFTRLWSGEVSDSTTLPMAVRGIGVRDMVIGIGTLIALENGGPAARWLEVGAAVDAGDAFATLASWRRLPGLRRLGLIALEAGSAWVGLGLAANLED